jgi:tRNA-Thr(GGU) m(6)t(6)A37 methyltransferase TsaA
VIGERCYVGHGAILRGDYGAIEIGDETAIEEGVIIHARPEDWARIGQRVTLGHGAMVHNATIHEGAVIGMRAVISDFSDVGAGAIVGEMTLVKNNQEIPSRKIAVGVPARVVGDVDQRHHDMTRWAKDLYVDLAERYAAGGLVELQSEPPSRVGLQRLVSVGVIHTPFVQPGGAPVQGALVRDVEGVIQLDPAYQEGLAHLEGFSHIVLIYSFHRCEGYRLTVTPHLDSKPRGLFATRAPRRPNPIGMTVVRILEVTGCRLRIAGVDMLDGTPLLDIKPYVPAIDCVDGALAGWLKPDLSEPERKGGPPAGERSESPNDRE